MTGKPSSKEEEYIARIELERKKKNEAEKLKRIAEEGKRVRRELHYMCCPKCGMELSEIDHKGVKVDKCISCGGIWFDAGEIEVLINSEKSVIEKLLDVLKK